jgi:proline dehydrogenase
VAGVPFYAKRFVCGTAQHDALECAQALAKRKIQSSLDLLGENITKPDEAKAFAKEYVTLIQAISSQKLPSHVSLKLTMLGLDLSQELCEELLHSVLKTADEANCRVALDMEGTLYTEKTLRMYEKMCVQYKSPEAVLQAYLHRTPEDVQRVAKSGGRFRLCKGAYKEKPTDALQNMKDIQKQYLELATVAFEKATHVCLATHDDHLLDALRSQLMEQKIPTTKYEFQMLYGMRSQTWDLLVQQGHPMTVYVPYGENWQAYFARRLAERKENVFFVLKNLFRS